jgi:hypothetical protein
MAKGGGSSGGGGGSTQPAVDPFALGQAQQRTNIATAQNQAQLNNINTFSPFGSSVYTPSIDPNTGLPSSFKVDQRLSDPLQQLFNTQTGLTQRLVDQGFGQLLPQGMNLTGMAMDPLQRAATMTGGLPTGLDLSNVQPVANLTPGAFQTAVTAGAGGQPLPGVQTAAGTGQPVQTSVSSNFPTLIKQAQDAAYQQQTQYLDPQFSQGRQQLTQQLADQGLQPGTEAYDRAMGDFNRQQQMAYQSAQTSAVQAGNAQEQSLFGQSLGAGQFANAAQGQMFGQALQGGEFANQAQQQMFGQGFNQANLYNQAVLGSANQNLQAMQGNLARSQAMFGAPFTAANAQLGIGQGLFGAGMGTIPTVSGLTGIAPTWPLSIPTMGGQQTVVPPTNLAAGVQAATGANQAAYGQGQQNLSNLLGFANTGSQALTGQSLGGMLGGSQGLFGGGGLLGSLFSGGSALTPEAAGAASGFGSAFGAGALDLGMLF